MNGDVVKSWIFKSSSSDKEYETRQYSDGSTSCNCKGWCILRPGQTQRICRHTSMVEHGIADSRAVSVNNRRPTQHAPETPARIQAQAKPVMTKVRNRKVVW